MCPDISAKVIASAGLSSLEKRRDKEGSIAPAIKKMGLPLTVCIARAGLSHPKGRDIVVNTAIRGGLLKGCTSLI